MSIAVFLDRDGVINVRRDQYVLRWSEFRFLEGVLPALVKLTQYPVSIVVVTNQSAIGRGLLQECGMTFIHKQMMERIQQAGGRIDRIYVCPHRPDEGCSCRKPEPGLLLRAARELNLELESSYMVDDNPRDLQAAHVVGCKAVLIGGELESETASGVVDWIAPDLAQAVDWICQDL